jgi:hypothetical protein
MTRYAIVPVEATEEMALGYAQACVEDSAFDGPSETAVWQNMLTAAPNPLEDAELVERVARAIYAEYEKIPRSYRGQMNGLIADDLARAAIAAIGGK